jgi:hypothetical protein
MRKYLAIALMVTFVVVTDGFAQNGRTVSVSPPSAKVIRSSDFSFVLKKITSIDVATQQSDGKRLPGPRHRIVGSYTPNTPPCPSGSLCPQVIPVPVELSVFLRSWEHAKDRTNACMLNVCLSSIESAGADSSVILRGSVSHDTKSSVLVLHSISSCFVGTAARIY